MKLGIGLLLAAGTALGANATLPTKEILGEEYYVYEVKKGDSLYGISHRYGWDETELLRLNPQLAEGLQKGSLIYYPTGKSAVVEVVSPVALSEIEIPQTLTHQVKHGETVYGIASQYGIPVDAIYAAHPSAKSGIKAGEKIIINQKEAGLGTTLPYFYIEIKPGDTLYSLARNYNTSVEDLLKSNPAITESAIKSGNLLRVPVSDSMPKVTRKLVNKEELASISTVRAEKNDTWTDLSRRTGVSVEELREANQNVTGRLQKDDVIVIPNMQTVEIEEETAYVDPREEQPEGRKEIYDEVHHLDGAQKGVKLVLMLDDPSARRDAEFARGFLMALKEMGNPLYPVDFKVISGAEALDDVIASIDDFRPSAIINISDKGVAEWMINYGNEAGTEIINIFDAKTDSYLSAPSVIQLMTPSNYFYTGVAQELESKFGNRRIIAVTKTGTVDPLGEAISDKFGAGKVTTSLVDGLSSTFFKDGESYLVYADVAERDDIENLLKKVASIREERPFIDIAVVGKPNWVMYADPLAETFYLNDVYIPSRFFFSADDANCKQFIENYSAIYGRGPLKSYPNYAASGWDVANWFIPTIERNGGDFNNNVFTSPETLQTPISLQRVSNWGGFYNPSALLIHFTPYRTVEKINIL